MLDEGGLAAMMMANKALVGEALLGELLSGLSEFQASDQFADDVSAALFEYRGPTG